MESNPLVTVNILSYNRKDELRNTLQKVFEQDYKNIEVIVVDNASTDSTVEMVEKEFSSVKLVKLDKNIGIAGWNEGFKIAKGEYVLVLDDDAFPAKDAIQKAIENFNGNETIGCITLNILDINRKNRVRTNWLPSEDILKCEWPIFVGCAVIFRNFGEVFYMPTNYFLYQHELPVAARIRLSRLKIYYQNDIIAYHYFKDQQNYNYKNDILCFQNNLNFILTYIPYSVVIFYFIQQALYYFTRSIRKGWFKQYVNIIININYKQLYNRKISIGYLMELRRLHIFNYGLFSKIF